jgi:hypothetical protein
MPFISAADNVCQVGGAKWGIPAGKKLYFIAVAEIDEFVPAKCSVT